MPIPEMGMEDKPANSEGWQPSKKLLTLITEIDNEDRM